MKPIGFPEQTNTLQPSGAAYSENVTGVSPLPTWTDGEQSVSCWRMSWPERFKALVYGKVWISALSGKTQPPIYAEVAKTYFKASP